MAKGSGAPKTLPVAPRPVRAYVRAHPWVSWGTIAAVVSTMAILASGVLWIIDHLETKSEAAQHAQRDAVKDAWQAYGIADMRKLILQKWVAECDSKKSKTDDCNTAKSQYEDAKQRAVDGYKAAMDAGKEKP